VGAIFMGRTYDWVESKRKPLVLDTDKLMKNKVG